MLYGNVDIPEKLFRMNRTLSDIVENIYGIRAEQRTT